MSTRRVQGYAPRALAIPATIGLVFLLLPLIALISRVDSPTGPRMRPRHPPGT